MYIPLKIGKKECSIYLNRETDTLREREREMVYFIVPKCLKLSLKVLKTACCYNKMAELAILGAEDRHHRLTRKKSK